MAKMKEFVNITRQAPKAVSKPMLTFGHTLREYRLKAQLEQKDVGLACGVSAGAVSNWERDVARPDCSMVPTICKLLNMPVYAFFGMEPPVSPVLPAKKQQAQPLYTHDEMTLISDYRSLTEPNKQQLRTIVTAIVDSQEATRMDNYRRNFCHLVGHDVGLAAGFGGPIDDEPDTYPVFVRISREACRADDVFPVNGKSMEPEYPDGSLVFVERIDPSALSYGDVVACIVNGTPFVKIYSEEGLRSFNPAYSTITISDDDNVHLYGRVIGMVDPADIATGKETGELMKAFADEL